jgi:hypothetical protein
MKTKSVLDLSLNGRLLVDEIIILFAPAVTKQVLLYTKNKVNNIVGSHYNINTTN